MKRLAIAFTLGATWLASASPARADDAARAAELNREAAEHAKHGEWDVARALLAEAYRLRPDASLLVNLAASELKSDHAVDALRHLRAYLVDPHADPQVEQAVKTQLVPRAMAATGHLTLHFPAGARVMVDGQPLDVPAGATAATDDVKAGPHAIEILAAGTTSAQSVVANAGENLDVRPRPAAPPPVAPQAAPPPPVHDEPPPRPVSDTGFWSARHVVPLGLLVGGAVFAGAGGYFALDGSSKLHQADDLVSGSLGGSRTACSSGSAPSACQTLSDLHSSYDRDAGLATGFFVAGGALAAAAVVMWIVWPRPHESVEGTGGVTVRPYASAGGGGVAGTF